MSIKSRAGWGVKIDICKDCKDIKNVNADRRCRKCAKIVATLKD